MDSVLIKLIVVMELISKLLLGLHITILMIVLDRLFHCSPNVPHYKGNRATGEMKVGQTFTIEPMLCVGQHKEAHWPDNVCD